MSQSSTTKSKKVVLLGEGRVGKTCLCLRYVQNSFSDAQESTIQATYLEKKLNVGKNPIKLMIWDTAGQERFHALGPIYYRDAQGALLVYDITDRDSFGKVQHWVKELRKIVGPDIVLLIVGNKADLEKDRQVSDDDAQSYAKTVGASHLLCSAKSGKGVDNVFLELTKGMLKFDNQQTNGDSFTDNNTSSSSSTTKDKSSRQTVRIDNSEQPKRDTCC